jgi:hypothetical protein
MGRLSKQKRIIIEGLNKRLLNESNIDIDNVLQTMKYKFGFGDLSTLNIEEFDNWLGDVKDNMTEEEYATLLNDWVRSGGNMEKEI